ncbi:hypothetical protein HZB89_00360, partial [archaeon]|nr:hypothetical protein [archaeon]
MNFNAFLVSGLLFCCSLSMGCTQPSSPTGQVALANTVSVDDLNAVSGPALIDLFVMSQCPYGVQAESSFIEAL